ncbi:MAG: AI-2E family transporter [Chloroflexota bacterium]
MHSDDDEQTLEIAAEIKPETAVNIPPLAKSLAALALAGIALYLLQWAAPVATPIFFAMYLAAILSPLYRWLLGKGLKKGLVLLLLITGILGAGAAIAWLALVSVQGLQASLSSYDGQLAAKTAALVETISSDPDVAASISSFLSSLLVSALAVTIDVASNFLFAAVLTVFLLLEFDRFMGLATAVSQDRIVFKTLPSLVGTAIRYIGIRTRLNLITGAGVILLCLLFGVDYPLLWGAWAFMLSYIPYIGLLTAMIPPALLAWAESGPLYAILIVLGILIINLTIENVLEPGYTGKKLQLSPTIVFISFFFWGWLLGPLGALLSMPITVLLLLVFSANESTQWLADLMGRAEPESA